MPSADRGLPYSAVVGFVRSFGGYLAREEKITMNVICPDKIRTNINSAEAFDKLEAAGVKLIQMGVVLEAVKDLLGRNGTSGACFEITPNSGCFLKEPPDFTDPATKLSGEMTLELARHFHQPIYD